ncbi:gamma-glutamylcyclotransferase family protein [Mixta gaviniae]|uniref:Gamma-glutamylcyclotransferase family protein YtfP n=1 Tax=Mixta gaviniae TaxID=665914 RepID=A0A2L0IJW0_9GAMM|nr:gamma-glutamylcyclotransferase [Mixta gaviniae]AUX94863.1 gamma-glutamylcyclotransferase [Mixta gaviniae]
MRIIVYGSLRRKQGNSHWMTNAQWLGDHQIEGYDLYNLGHYPGVVPGEGSVYGEVYRIDASTLGELDALRTSGGEYKRQLIQTPYGSAWLYVYQRSVAGLTRISSGDWLQRDEVSSGE